MHVHKKQNKYICIKRTLDYFPKKYPEYANNWFLTIDLEIDKFI